MNEKEMVNIMDIYRKVKNMIPEDKRVMIFSIAGDVIGNTGKYNISELANIVNEVFKEAMWWSVSEVQDPLACIIPLNQMSEKTVDFFTDMMNWIYNNKEKIKSLFLGD